MSQSSTAAVIFYVRPSDLDGVSFLQAPANIPIAIPPGITLISVPEDFLVLCQSLLVSGVS